MLPGPAQLLRDATLLHYVQPVRQFVGGAVWWSFRGKYSPTALDCSNETGGDPAVANVADQHIDRALPLGAFHLLRTPPSSAITRA